MVEMGHYYYPAACTSRMAADDIVSDTPGRGSETIIPAVTCFLKTAGAEIGRNPALDLLRADGSRAASLRQRIGEERYGITQVRLIQDILCILRRNDISALSRSAYGNKRESECKKQKFTAHKWTRHKL